MIWLTQLLRQKVYLGIFVAFVWMNIFYSVLHLKKCIFQKLGHWLMNTVTLVVE